jgi:hypothetical protein
LFAEAGFPQKRRSGNPFCPAIRPRRYFEETIEQRADVTVVQPSVMAEQCQSSNMADQEPAGAMADSPLFYFAVLVWVTSAMGIYSEMPVPYWSALVALMAFFVFRYLKL